MKDENKKNGKKEQEKTDQNKTQKLVILAGLLLAGVIILLLVLNLIKKPEKEEITNPLPIDETQDVYVKPENPVDRSKVVTMPGWGSFTIPANTTTIDKGFEFHNPAENMWYEIVVSYDGEALEKIVVDSGIDVKLDHYLALAGIRSKAVELKDYDEKVIGVEEDEDGDLAIYAKSKFDGANSFTVKADDGKEYKFDLSCGYNCYYMQFSLYLGTQESGGELLYESGLVSPDMYIQKMEMNRALDEGTYDAYVFIQPYRSDRTTKTNSGTIVIKLNVK